MELLMLLVEADGQLVSRDDIMQAIWKDRVVTEYSLNNLISGLRKRLNAPGGEESYIITRPKLGYRLIASIERVDEPSNSPSRYKFGKRVKVSLLVLACTVLAFFSFLVFQSTSSKGGTSPSIAVLPFEVFDHDSEIEYFAHGLTEEVIHQLSRLPDLNVIARTLINPAREENFSVVAAGKRLNVSHILTGSVRKAEGTMRITLQLIDTVNGKHIWSRVFVANIENSFSIQHQISTEIAQTLDVSFDVISKEQKNATPISSEAYLHVLRGRKLNQQGTIEAHLQARDEFMMATLLEPEYAIAYVDLAVSYLLLQQQKRLANEEAVPLAFEAIEKALSIDSELAEAHTAMGILHHNLNNWKKAESAFEQALSLNPNLYLAILNYANLQRQLHKKEQALTFFRKAKALAPLSGHANWGVGITLIDLGRIDESIELFEKCVYLLPNFSNCWAGLSYSQILANQKTNAADSFQRFIEMTDKDDFWHRSISGYHYLWSGKYDEADTIYQGMLAQFGFDIDAIQSITLNKLKLDQQERWFERLDAFVGSANPLGQAVEINYALAAYYTNRCNIVIPGLEKSLSKNPELMESADTMANSVSYLAILAHCYKKTGDLQKSNEMLDRLQDMLSSLPKNQLFVGGFIFIEAQLHALRGNKRTASKMIKSLQKEQWPLVWLIDKDPILRSTI